MLKEIENFEINDNVTLEMLLANNFKIINNKYADYIVLLNKKYNIYLLISIPIDENYNIKYFDEFENVTIIDKDSNNIYIPFDKNKKFPILMEIINAYNEEMRKLCDKNILKVKKKSL